MNQATPITSERLEVAASALPAQHVQSAAGSTSSGGGLGLGDFHPTEPSPQLGDQPSGSDGRHDVLFDAAVRIAQEAAPATETDGRSRAITLASRLTALRLKSTQAGLAPIMIATVLQQHWNARNPLQLTAPEIAEAIELAKANPEPITWIDAAPGVDGVGNADPVHNLVALARELHTLFVADDCTALIYSRFRHKGACQVWPVDNPIFLDIIRTEACAREIKFTKSALSGMLDILKSEARLNAPRKPVGLRVARDGNDIVIDLADDLWRVMRVTAQGVAIENDSSVAFRRTHGMLPLPVPTFGGSLEPLRDLCNLGDPRAWRLACGWLLGALGPIDAYPILFFTGEKGSLKSTSTEMFRMLVDPHKALTRDLPKDLRNLMIAAQHNHVLAFNNVSSITPKMSDACCQASTGGSFAGRSLFTNDQETVLSASRPILFNGIPRFITASDLLDRSIVIDLPRVSPENRRSKTDVWREFHKVYPAMFGALLEALSFAVGNIDSVKLNRTPRMAEFARLAVAGAPKLGFSGEQFLRDYEDNLALGDELAIEGSPIGGLLLDLVEPGQRWEGEATDLLRVAERLWVATNGQRLPPDWPKNPARLSTELRRINPNLASIGVDVQFVRSGNADRRRIITITRAGPPQQHTLALALLSGPSQAAGQCRIWVPHIVEGWRGDPWPCECTLTKEFVCRRAERRSRGVVWSERKSSMNRQKRWWIVWHAWMRNKNPPKPGNARPLGASSSRYRGSRNSPNHSGRRGTR